MTRRRFAWTAAEDKRLTLMWGGKLTIVEIARRLGRGRRGTYDRALELGLGTGCPRGYEYTSAAARRVGMHRDSLMRILEWAKVPTFPALSIYTVKRWSRRYVDPLEVDEAVAAWLKTEPLNVAARRRGVTKGYDVKKLTQRLQAAGQDTRRRFKQHLRVSDEQLAQIGVAP